MYETKPVVMTLYTDRPQNAGDDDNDDDDDDNGGDDDDGPRLLLLLLLLKLDSAVLCIVVGPVWWSPLPLPLLNPWASRLNLPSARPSAQIVLSP